MKKVIITGGNGMIGKLVLKKCLMREDVEMVTSITRKTSGIKHRKLTEIFHDDFLNYSKIAHHLGGQDLCFYCIGVYTGKVPKDEFIEITVDFTEAFAKALKKNSPGASFCFLSGSGADSSEKSTILFAKQKGIAENILLKLKFKNTFIFRPGYIYPVTPRIEPNFSYDIMRAIYKPLSLIFPNIGLNSEQLARKMIEIGINGGDKVIYENVDIRL